jgi:alginate O-acetyltransferase complex protein AlgI
VNFVSWAFIGVFLVAFYARLTIGRRKVEPGYVAVLIATSALFYGWHVPAYLLILGGTALLDFAVALAIDRHPLSARSARRRWLLVSLVANLGVLALFKYGDFAARAVEDLSALVGGTVRLPELALVLPMGISFYTFQTLSYTLDVYRGQLAPVRSFSKFFLFVGFFPQLVAGPIVRASEFLPQIDRPRRLRLVAFYEGVWLLICGFFLKMVCADNLAAYVD